MIFLSGSADDEVPETLDKGRNSYITKSIRNGADPPAFSLPKVKPIDKRGVY